MIPLLPTAIAAAKSSAVASAVSGAREGVKGFFGDTDKDKQRKARAAGLTTAALAGDANALRQLVFDAFEPSVGALGDDRRPDGTRSPPLSRDLAVSGLKQYAKRFGGIPQQYAKYAERINAAVTSGPPPLLEQILTPAIDQITDTALDRAAERGSDTLRRYMPLIVAGVVVVGFVLYAASKRKS